MTANTQENSAQSTAVGVFTELGWAESGDDYAAALSLPLGTEQQQRTARRDIDQAKSPYSQGVNLGMFALFAFRLGIKPARVTELMRHACGCAGLRYGEFATTKGVPDEFLAAALGQNGSAYAEKLVRTLHARGERWLESPRHGDSRDRISHAVRLTSRLVDAFELPVPSADHYLQGWNRLAALVIVEDSDKAFAHIEKTIGARPTTPREGPEHWVDEGVILRRFDEHIHAVTASAAAVMERFGPLPHVLAAAGQVDALSRDEALDLAFTGLDATVRPSDRKIWAESLRDDFRVLPEELGARADALLGILANGPASVVEVLGPGLVATVPRRLLADVVTAGVSAGTKKSTKLMLQALNPRLSETTGAESTDGMDSAVLHEVLAPLAQDTDSVLARLAGASLASLPSATKQTEQTEEAEQAGNAVSAGPAAGGWTETPQLWDGERLRLPDITIEDFGSVLGQLAVGTSGPEPEDFVLTLEKAAFLTNALARDHLGELISYCSKQEEHSRALRLTEPLERAGRRRAGEELPAPRLRQSDYVHILRLRRDDAVEEFAGSVPVLLSTPTWTDFRIDPADLISRLRLFAEAGATADVFDLLLALRRLDTSLVTTAHEDRIPTQRIPVRGEGGEILERGAEEITRAYLGDPYLEPAYAYDPEAGRRRLGPVHRPQSLARIKEAKHSSQLTRWNRSQQPEMFPTFDEATIFGPEDEPYINVREDGRYGESRDGIARFWDTVTRRSRALPGQAVVHLLCDIVHPGTPAAQSRALVDIALRAWDRGLLLPERVDARYFGDESGPANLGALAKLALDFGQDGLTSLVWPLLDGLVARSAEARRMYSGTVDLMGTLRALLPEVRAAVNSGLAPESALTLPGVRALAQRSGSSAAVKSAKDLVTLLPEVGSPAPGAGAAAPGAATPGTATTPEQTRAALAVPADFDAVWPADAPAVDNPRDPGEVVITPIRIDEQWGPWATVVYPQEPSVSREVTSAWGGSGGFFVWTGNLDLSWDGTQIVVVPDDSFSTMDRADWRARHDVIPLSFVRLALVYLSRKKAAPRTIGWVVRELRPDDGKGWNRGGRIGCVGVRDALRVDLPGGLVDPRRLARILEKEPALLPVLWPVLTEAIRHAGAEVEAALAAGVRPGSVPIPTWAAGVLDTALILLPYLAEAIRRGLIPADDACFAGLEQLATCKKKAAAVSKAQELAEVLKAEGLGVEGLLRAEAPV